MPKLVYLLGRLLQRVNRRSVIDLHLERVSHRTYDGTGELHHGRVRGDRLPIVFLAKNLEMKTI
jgi:hypothetical protein